jgi:protein translocase SecG subunit
MKRILFFLQIIIPTLLILLILLQQRGTALGAAFGGEGGFYLKRRGIEKKIFWGTVILGALFLAISLLNLII